MRSLPFSLTLLCLTSTAAHAALSPEDETLRLSEQIRSIPDEEWNQIAGSITDEKYEVIQGDNLYDISQRLFGNGLYWPKIWALNNDKITNPHLIYPGQMVVFTTGSGTTLPTLGSSDPEPNTEPELPPVLPSPVEKITEKKDPYGVQISQNDPLLRDALVENGSIIDGAKIPANRGRSQEWKYLTRQRWESAIQVDPNIVDELGFDRRSVIRLNASIGTELHYLVSSDDLVYLGEIKSSWGPSRYLTLGDKLYVSPNGDLQVGQDYTITSEPTSMSGGALAYPNIGLVRITGSRSDLMVAEVKAANGPIERNMFLVQKFPRTKPGIPKPGPAGVEGRARLSPRFDNKMGTQYTQVMVDRGSDEGVELNMVFRAYQYVDPASGNDITSEDFIRLADIQVLHVTRNYSVGWLIYSRLPITDGTSVRLLTDVSDLLPPGSETILKDEPNIVPPPVEEKEKQDELDLLETGGDLSPDELKELEQLENWEDNPAEPFEFEDELDGSLEESKQAPLPSDDSLPPEEVGGGEFGEEDLGSDEPFFDEDLPSAPGDGGSDAFEDDGAFEGEDL